MGTLKYYPLFLVLGICVPALAQNTGPVIHRAGPGDNLHTYRLSSGDADTWQDRRAMCQGIAGTSNLVTIEDDDTKSFIDTNLGLLGVVHEDQLWIGASSDNPFSDKRTGEPMPDLGGTFRIASGYDTLGYNYIYAHYDNGNAGVNDNGPTWTFVSTHADELFGVICEVEHDDRGERPAGERFDLEIEAGVYRYFYYIDGNFNRATAVDGCDGEGGYDSWLAVFSSNAELNLMEGVAQTPTDHMWLAIEREDPDWTWVNGEEVDPTDNGFENNHLPVYGGFAYLTYSTTDDSVWSNDARSAQTARDAICETITDFETSICKPDGPCYQLTIDPGTWDGARTACAAMPGVRDLAVVDVEADRVWLKQNIARLGVGNDQDVWFGASADEAAWTWVDGRAVESFPWETNHPSDDECGHLRYSESPISVTWRSDDCGTATRHGICMTPRPICRDHDGTETCYSLTVTSGSQQEVREACTSKGLELLVIDDAEEQTWLDANLGGLVGDGYRSWMGLSYEDGWNWDRGYGPEEDNWADPPEAAHTCAHLQWLEEDGGDATWVSGTCDGPLTGICESPQDPAEPPPPEDDGLSDGEIAAIAVSSTVVVGAAAGGGGYYAYSKSAGGKVEPNDGGESGEGYKKDEEEQEGGEGEGEEGEQQPEEETPAGE